MPASLLTMTFAQIPGSPAAVVGRMGDALADAIARLCLMQAMMQAITIQQTGSQ
jgi:hypothetical protein